MGRCAGLVAAGEEAGQKAEIREREKLFSFSFLQKLNFSYPF
jgi:hypothetical protein